MARAISREDGMNAVHRWAEASGGFVDGASDGGAAGGGTVDRAVVAMAVRWTLQVLAADAPGRSVEVRVPPWGAVQCIEGPRHTRGTPPNVVEMKPEVWLKLATGKLQWDDAYAAGSIAASGERANISHWLPIVCVSK